MRTRDYYVLEVEHLTFCGESPQTIATHLGVSAAALAKAMARADRPDLARLFYPLISKTRRGRCVDCGRPTSDARAPRCRACSQPVRVATRYGRAVAA